MSFRRYCNIFLLLLLLLPVDALPQQGFINFGVQEGLPSNETYQVFQDSKGYIWVATDRGVSRFNGYEFENFTTKDGLPDNTIFAFFEDHKGRIWFNSYNGKIGYYYNQQFVTFNSNHRLQYILSLYVDRKDIIYVAYVATPQKYYAYQLCSPDSIALVTDLLTASRMHYPPGSAKDNVRTDSNEVVYISNNVLITADKNDQLLHSLPMNTRLNHLFLRGSDLYATTFGEWLYILTAARPHSSIDSIEFTQCRLSSTLIDRDGGMWVSTLNQGIYFKAKSDMYTLKGIENITDAGLAQYYRQENYALIVNKKDQIFIRKNNTTEKIANGNSVVKQITTHQDLTYVSNNSHVFTFDAQGKCQTSDITSYCFTFDKQNRPWTLIGNTKLIRLKWTKKGMLTYDTSFFHVQEEKNRTHVCHEDTIWLGGINGLSYFEINTQTFHTLQHPLSKHRVEDIKTSTQGILFMATRGAGLIIKKGNTFLQISQKEGLINNLLDHLLLDHDTIWVSSHTGISRIVIENYHPLKYQITNITTADGLLSKQINYICAFRDTIYAATDKGVNYFHKNFQNERIVPIVEITNIQIGTQSAPLQQQYELTYRQNTLLIDFLGLYYPDPHSLYYWYRLCSETDSTWHSIQGRRISFSSLTPGNYAFELKAITPNGVESASSAQVLFVIHPPFWNTWWFKTILIAIAAILIYLFFKVNILSYNREITRRILLSILQRVKKQKSIEVKNILDGSTCKILIHLILYAKSDTHYVHIQLRDNKNVVTRIPLKELLELLQQESSDQFVQIHKSYVVNTHMIDVLHRQFVRIGNHEIPIGRAYKINLKM